jgi:hypothetical protein
MLIIAKRKQAADTMFYPEITSGNDCGFCRRYCRGLLLISNNRGNSGWQRRRRKTEAPSKKAKATTAKKHPVQQTDQTDITNTRRPIARAPFH